MEPSMKPLGEPQPLQVLLVWPSPWQSVPRPTRSASKTAGPDDEVKSSLRTRVKSRLRTKVKSFK
jgi:hypothetical protein